MTQTQLNSMMGGRRFSLFCSAVQCSAVHVIIMNYDDNRFFIFLLSYWWSCAFEDFVWVITYCVMSRKRE